MEEDAYREFASFFGPRLRAFFLGRGLTAAEAEDLATSCVTDIALKVGKYEASRGGHFEAWVFTLARRALIDRWRRRRPTEPLPDDLAFPGPLDGDDSEDLADAVDALREAVAKLPAGDQALVNSRYLGGIEPFSHIAERLGIQPETARVRHHRALRRLRALLETDPRIQRLLQRGSAA